MKSKLIRVISALAFGLFANAASAANLGAFNVNCNDGGTAAQALAGSIGDTFTITATGAGCFLTITPVAAATWTSTGNGNNSPAFINLNSSATITIVAGGALAFNAVQMGNGTNFTITVPVASAPVSVPTLSEWGLMLMAGLMALFGLAQVRRHR